MDRYINATKCQVEDIPTRFSDYCQLDDVQWWLDNQPTADVEEVKHGELIVCGTFDDFLKCSECQKKYPFDTAIEFKYCPACGAKMDGKEKEE